MTLYAILIIIKALLSSGQKSTSFSWFNTDVEFIFDIIPTENDEFDMWFKIYNHTKPDDYEVVYIDQWWECGTYSAPNWSRISKCVENALSEAGKINVTIPVGDLM